MAIALLEQNKKKTASYSRGRPSQNETLGVKYDTMNNFIIPQDKQTKCQNCHTKTTPRCPKCDVDLHVKCFVKDHTC